MARNLIEEITEKDLSKSIKTLFSKEEQVIKQYQINNNQYAFTNYGVYSLKYKSMSSKTKLEFIPFHTIISVNFNKGGAFTRSGKILINSVNFGVLKLKTPKEQGYIDDIIKLVKEVYLSQGRLDTQDKKN